MILKRKPEKAFLGMALGVANKVLDKSTKQFQAAADITNAFANQATAGGAFSMATDAYDAARSAEPMFEEGGMILPFKRKRKFMPKEQLYRQPQKYGGGGLFGKVQANTTALANVANAAINMAQANKMNRKWAGYEAETDEFGNAVVNEDLMKDQAAMAAPQMSGVKGLALNWLFRKKAKKQAEAQADKQREDYGRQHFSSFGNFNRQQDAAMASNLQPPSAGISPVTNPATMPSQAGVGMARQGGRLPEKMFFGGPFASLMQAIYKRRHRHNNSNGPFANTGLSSDADNEQENTLDINLKVSDNSDKADVEAKAKSGGIGGSGIEKAADGNTAINEETSTTTGDVEEAERGTKMVKKEFLGGLFSGLAEGAQSVGSFAKKALESDALTGNGTSSAPKPEVMPRGTDRLNTSLEGSTDIFGKKKPKKPLGSFTIPGKPSKTLIRKDGGILEEPGKVNVVVKGKLHKENNNLGNKDKGVPVVSPDGKKTYEVEKQELIFRKEVTDLIEGALRHYDKIINDDEKLAKLGAVLRKEILTNTQDNDGRFGVRVEEEEEV